MEQPLVDLNPTSVNSYYWESGESPSVDVSNFEPVQISGSDPRLPQPDGGKEAWLFLTACFILEALIWGFPFTYGIFQDFYSKEPQFKDSPNVALIGTCAVVSSNLSIE
jgi:hypothetical protein